MHICSLNWKNELLSTISEFCSITVWCYFSTFSTYMYSTISLVFQNSQDTFILWDHAKTCFMISWKYSVSPPPSSSLVTIIHQRRVCCTALRENNGSERDNQGVGWDMSISFNLYLTLDWNGRLFPQSLFPTVNSRSSISIDKINLRAVHYILLRSVRTSDRG